MEEKSKKVRHTPGPWVIKPTTYKLSGTDKVHEYHVYSGRDFICTTHAPHDLLTNALEHEAVCEANARLIAAAPSLLEALEEINSEDYDTSMSNKHLCAAIYRLKGIAYNAIKLAKGNGES